jgi:hypothetical protein
MNRFLFAACLLASGLVPLRPALADTAFARLPGEQGKTSPLLMRIVQYQGSVNGVITVEVKNPTGNPQEFSAKGLYFVPTGNANEAPQRLGAVGPFQLQSRNGPRRLDRATIAPGAIERMTLDVYCIDSHRGSPSSSTTFRLAKDRVPPPLVRAIDDSAEKSAASYGGVSAPAARSAVQSEVWRNRDGKWIELDGEGKQEAAKAH